MSILSAFTDKSQHKINIREYTPKYGGKLIQLATVVDEINGMNGLVNAKRIYDNDFHVKSEKYKDSAILLAEHTPETTQEDEPTVCGSVELGVKEAWIDGQVCRIGVISDLRVHPSYRRQGLGSKLVEQIEEVGKKKGIDMFYILVSQQNKENGQVLLEKLGYQASNESDNLTLELSKYARSKPEAKAGSETILFREISKARAKELLRQYYEKKDFFNQDIDEYLNNPDYEGTYIVETADGETYGGVNLYRNPTESKMMLQKLLVPMDFAYNKYVHIPVMSVMSLMAATLYVLLNGKIGINPKTSATITIGVNIGLLLAYTKFINALRKVSGREPRCRYTGIFYKGKEEYKKDVFSLLFSNVEHLAYGKGYRYVNMNVDRTEPWRKYLPEGETRNTSSLFTKAIGKKLESLKQGKMFENFSFYDPRDW